MNLESINKIITLGPATREVDLGWLKAKGVDFVRNNMSHSSLDDLVFFIDKAKEAGIPFILDTEGSQVRTSRIENNGCHFEENHVVRICKGPMVGDADRLGLTPGFVIEQLEIGDLIHVDFDTLILLVVDTATAVDGFVTAKAINNGYVGNNKAVFIDRVSTRCITLPALTVKDTQAIVLGLQAGVQYIAASFVRSAEALDEVRAATQGKMAIISKIECVEALKNLDGIIENTDYLLLDRGDLSKEIPLEKIPLAQKTVIVRARRKGKGVVVATNLLETMIERRKPTRAEVNDVVSTIQDGAIGLTLAAETAIGKYPLQCINILNALIKQVESDGIQRYSQTSNAEIVEALEKSNYLFDSDSYSTLAKPHGGRLTDRILRADPSADTLERMADVRLNDLQLMDLRQIATGVYSPLTGFMVEDEVHSVLDSMLLPNGVVWPIPVVLDVSADVAATCRIGDEVVLRRNDDRPAGTLIVKDKYEFDKESFAKKLYGTVDPKHPGVAMVMNMQPVLLGGPIKYLPQPEHDPTKAYDLTPRQVRRLFEERSWSRVVGFHTRNIPHRAHEYIQTHAMEKGFCDGMLVHPIVGKKKPGDFQASFIIECYEHMIRDFYPRNKVIFAIFSTFSRYAGPKEAVFTALCRKNFGCSHFIVGRDHTGVGNYYDPYASHRIFDRFPDLGIVPICFDTIVYSERRKTYLHATETPDPSLEDQKHISGSQIRQMFERGERPPSWIIRPEISEIIVAALANKESVFVDA